MNHTARYLHQQGFMVTFDNIEGLRDWLTEHSFKDHYDNINKAGETTRNIRNPKKDEILIGTH